MAKEVLPPRFINAQGHVVTIHNQRKQPISVVPYAWRDRTTGTFVLEGEYYRQFLHPQGPLSPFPEEPVDVPVVVVAPKPPPPQSISVGKHEETQSAGTSAAPIEIDKKIIHKVDKVIKDSKIDMDVDERTEVLTYVLKKAAGEPYELPDAFVELIPALDKIVDGMKKG